MYIYILVFLGVLMFTLGFINEVLKLVGPSKSSINLTRIFILVFGRWSMYIVVIRVLMYMYVQVLTAYCHVSSLLVYVLQSCMYVV